MHTDLHAAAREGDLTETKRLLRTPEGARPLNDRDREGWSPLHYAAFNGHRAVVATLIAAGASLEVQSLTGWTPLHCAAFNGRHGATEELIGAGAKVEAQSFRRETPRDVASNRDIFDATVAASWIPI